MPSRSTSPPIIVSFSGLDGAGKSTQIALLRESIAHLGLSSRLLNFRRDVAIAMGLRTRLVHRAFEVEQGSGRAWPTMTRRDRNLHAPWLTAARCLGYLIDACSLRWALFRRRRTDVLICDCYLYDELANLPLHRPLMALYARLLTRIAPCPALALLVDVEPEMARSRKPEYPLPFLLDSRRAYFRLASLVGGMTVLPPLPIEDARRAVLTAFLRVLSLARPGNTARPGDSTRAAA